MTEQRHNTGLGSPLMDRLLDQGDPAFVDELRRCDDAERLKAFAPRWYIDRRPGPRRLLLEYLERPLNAFRHEPLVKGLFKLAERAGDDEALGRFLVLFDRSVRRERQTRHRTEWARLDSREEAEALVRQWQAEGYDQTSYHATGWRGQFSVYGRRPQERVRVPGGTTMPRRPRWSGWDRKTGGRHDWPKAGQPLSERERARLEGMQLFTLHTRYYLRRRAWRYFRNLGRQHPERYVAAVAAALKQYEDEDVADGLALLDNWGLVHALFHHSPALVARPNGWILAARHKLSELTPAPIYEERWRAAPRALLGLLREARSRTVRLWVARMLRRHEAARAEVPLDDWLALLGHEEPEIATLAAESLRGAPGLGALPASRWLALLETPNPEALDVLCGLVTEHLRPEQVTLEEVVSLAASRPLPVARLGFTWLRDRIPATEDECRALLRLTDAGAEALRPEMVRWARGVLAVSACFRGEWVLEYLDSRHADVRAEGWAWLQQDARLRDDVEIWRRLLESPYDDVRLRLVHDLEQRVARGERQLTDGDTLDAGLLRFLWASVLLNVHRGGRAKPVAVSQLVRRLERRPGEAAQLLPLLSGALRSVRGPEWRAGLAGVVRLLERRPELAPAVREAFAELKWE